MKSNIFKLSHLVLYAKGWYKKSDNVWEDLIKILELDGYQPNSKGDIYSIILINFNDFDHRASELFNVMNGIHPYNTNRISYFTTVSNYDYTNLKEYPEYDMPTAFIYYVLNSLNFIEFSSWDAKVPKYKLYPKSEHITLKKVIEIFNNKTKSK